MGTAELKSYLHQLIVETNDNSILEKVQSYFLTLRQRGEDVDWWDEISDEEKKAIEAGIQQLKKGESFTHEQVREDIDKLLGRK